MNDFNGQNHQYILDWQKQDISDATELNKINILGLLMLSDVDPAYFINHHNPLEHLSPYLPCNFQSMGSLVQDSEKVFAKIVNSPHNHTKYNAFHFIVSDSLNKGVEILKSSKQESEEISIILISSPSIISGKYDTENTIHTLNSIIELGFNGKIIGITHRGGENELKKECLRKKIPVIQLDEGRFGYNHKCYRFELERALIKYFNKPEVNPPGNIYY